MHKGGYQTAMVGKWHLGQGPRHHPTGFDFWRVLPGQGLYHDPEMIDETYEPEWELFDLEQDPCELNNVYSDPAYADVVAELTGELHRLQDEVGDSRYEKDC